MKYQCEHCSFHWIWTSYSFDYVRDHEKMHLEKTNKFCLGYVTWCRFDVKSAILQRLQTLIKKILMSIGNAILVAILLMGMDILWHQSSRGFQSINLECNFLIFVKSIIELITNHVTKQNLIIILIL